MMTIELKELKFHAYHGVYAEERILGGPFQVSLVLSYHEKKDTITELADTINYQVVYEIVAASMSAPRDLLETLAQEIVYNCKQSFPNVASASCSIYKMNPPVPNFEGKLGVTFQKDFHVS